MIGQKYISRFWSKVDMSAGADGCWTWTASRFRDGYGQFWTGPEKGTVPAHRFAFLVSNGRWPEPCCLHRCDNPPCCNPAHLFEGTNSENMADKVAKGRQTRGDSHPSRLYPERRPRGDAHWTRVKPGNLATGSRNGAYTAPHRVRRCELNGRAKLTWDAVREIRAAFAAGSATKADLSRKFGVSRPVIDKIVKNELWKEKETGHVDL